MATVFRSIKITPLAYDNFVKRKIKMEEVARKITGRKKVVVPLSRVISLASEKPLIIDDTNLMNMLKRKKRGKRLNVI